MDLSYFSQHFVLVVLFDHLDYFFVISIIIAEEDIHHWAHALVFDVKGLDNLRLFEYVQNTAKPTTVQR